jgi:hypothetical protein
MQKEKTGAIYDPLREQFSFGINMSSTFKMVSFRKWVYIITITLSAQIFISISWVWNKTITNLALTEGECLKSKEVSRYFPPFPPPPPPSSLENFLFDWVRAIQQVVSFTQLVNVVELRVLFNLLNILHDFKPAVPVYVD